MKSRPLIVVSVTADMASRRRMVEGIARFIHHKADWDVVCLTHATTQDALMTMLRRADGLLSGQTGSEFRAIAQTFKPCVMIGESVPDANCVVTDENEIGEIAASHFASLGLRSAAYCGVLAPFSNRRRDGLASGAKTRRMSFSAYPRTVYAQMDNDPHELEPFQKWLMDLPKPTGLLCTTCEVAHAVLHHCRTLNLHIPNDLAVLGVDDDELMCEITPPHLSTIDDGSFDAGYRAAQLLDELLKVPDRRPTHIVVKPRPQVIARESTDLVFADSPAVGLALRYVRQHACSPVAVADILRQVPISRRALERGFLRNVGRTVHQEVLRLRLGRAKTLLMNTDLKLPHVAEQSGFSSAAALCNIFRRELKTTPAHYRSASRSGF